MVEANPKDYKGSRQRRLFLFQNYHRQEKDALFVLKHRHVSCLVLILHENVQANVEADLRAVTFCPRPPHLSNVLRHDKKEMDSLCGILYRSLRKVTCKIFEGKKVEYFC